MPWGDNSPTDRILRHLADIGAGRCTITDDCIVAEPDPEMGQVLLALLVLHEDLTYSGRLRAEAEARIRSVAEERERLLEERRQAVIARDQFLAVAAHELRTPLSTLGLLVDHLIATRTSKSETAAISGTDQEQQLVLLRGQVERLSALVAQMLDVAQMTRGGLDLVPRPVDMREIASQVLERFELDIRRRGVSVDMTAPDPVRGTWDAERIDQVVTNLISNAIKYGAGRPIEVSVRAAPPWAVVRVRDHGVGIPDGDQGRIFGPFVRATTARHHAGLGLGLWIVHQIVLASGGRINVDSRLGEGSTFTLELPL